MNGLVNESKQFTEKLMHGFDSSLICTTKFLSRSLLLSLDWDFQLTHSRNWIHQKPAPRHMSIFLKIWNDMKLFHYYRKNWRQNSRNVWVFLWLVSGKDTGSQWLSFLHVPWKLCSRPDGSLFLPLVTSHGCRPAVLQGIWESTQIMFTCFLLFW